MFVDVIMTTEYTINILFAKFMEFSRSSKNTFSRLINALNKLVPYVYKFILLNIAMYSQKKVKLSNAVKSS